MTNWFQTSAAKRLFRRNLFVEHGAVSCLAQIQGWAFSKRAIIHGGFATDDIDSKQIRLGSVLKDIQKQADLKGCIYVEMRCYDDYSAFRSQLEKAGWVYQPHYDVTLDPNKDVPDAKMRQIRSAMEQGEHWREAQSEDDVKAWYKCLSELYRQKVRRPLPPCSFFVEAWKQGVPLLVVEQRSIIGGVLMPVLNDKAWEWYICGQVMSTWAMIDYARQHKINGIDMMGAGVPDVPYGVRDFKLQMGGELHEWGRYLYILRPRLYRLGCWIIQLLSKTK